MTEDSKSGLTCEELLQGLNDYVDNETLTALCRQFADHLAGCSPCQVVVDNVRNTIRIYKAGEVYPMPPEFHARLRAALEAKWKKAFPVADV